MNILRTYDLLSWQPDLYQRYELLRQVLHATVGDGATTRVRVIDVGSGPERLTELSLGAGFEIIRADVETFDDNEVVRIHPGTPLPFADDASDVVIAMDVLEHVPAALRSSFVEECSRVARKLVVITCPTQHDAVNDAEDELSRIMVGLSGKPVDFLDEHAAYGLPTDVGIVSDLERSCGPVAVLQNAPLAIWSSTNLIDFVLNLRLADAAVKQRVNRSVNEDSIVCTSEQSGYRQFFLASPDQSIDVISATYGVIDPGTVPSLSSIVGSTVEILASELQNLGNQLQHLGRGEVHVASAEARAEALRLQISALTVAVQRARHMNDEAIRAQQSVTEQLDTSRRELAASRTEYDRLLELLDDRERVAPASVDELVPTEPPITMRMVAGKARRSPRWAARKARGAYRRLGRPRQNAPMTLEVGVAQCTDNHQLSDAAPARFDRHWYAVSNPDVSAAGIDPWLHYVLHGRLEGRSPHPLFDRAWYVAHYPQAVADGADPFIDWATTGVTAHRNPNEFVDIEWYLRRHPEVGEAGLDPVEHYRLHGWREGRRPGPLFDPTWYLGTYRDVADADMDPLTHFIQFGRGEGRHANHLEHVAAAGWYRPPDGLIPWFSPVNFGVRADLADHPRLNVLLPGMGVRHLTGGPNTAIQLAYRLAAIGQPVRFIATDAALDDDTSALWAHMATISDVGRRLANVEVVDGSNRYRGVEIGENDLFMATAWWTAQSVKAALPLVRQQRFLYLIQDFEPLFFASSSQYALALETYGLDHVPIINSRFLLDHLAHEQVGRFADPDFVDSAIVFEPTVDRTLFRPTVPTSARHKRRLLFYARPQNGLRNLFELGTAAIQMAIQQEVLDEDEWEFCGMGDPFEPVAVGPRSVLRPLPWRNFNGYAEQMRESDILLSLMLAPHPSYPPLEMAACGGIAVTTEFGPKTAVELAAISPNIIGTPATIEGIAQGLADAADRLVDVSSRWAGSALALPETWSDVFAQILPAVESRLAELADPSRPTSAVALTEPPPNHYNRWRSNRIEDRVSEYSAPILPREVTFSLLTAVWNTPGEYLRELADSICAQDLAHGWEWVIADNGSTNPETLAVLEDLGGDARIRIQRHADNLGILGGMRSCLERAAGRYILHMDHDDLLTPDALRVVASSLDANGWPDAFYTDEDKVRGRHFLEPYLKPDWDPVLFANSCYIAHLCGVNRKLALELDAYLDPYTEASPDWDLFTRFATNGVAPHHIPEVVYSWRIHASSTAGNPNAKPYALATHRRVLERFIGARADFDRFTVEVHPDSPDQLDWWLRRRHVDPRPLVTVIIGESQSLPFEPLALVDHQIESIDIDDVDRFVAIIESANERNALIHVLNASAHVLRRDWYWEAFGLFELYDDVVAVGGATIRNQCILSAGEVFGFGPDGWGSPECGESHDARGWFGQNLKQRSVDGIPADHAVFDAALLRRTLTTLPSESQLSTIGAWASIQAARDGARVVYSPLLRADVTHPFSELWTESDRIVIGGAASTVASPQNRSGSLSLDAAHPHRATTLRAREKHLCVVRDTPVPPSVSYHDWLTSELTGRSARYPTPDMTPSISIITPVYAGTDAALFGELAKSLAEQSLPFHEWIIGLDGEIGSDLADAVAALTADGSAMVRTAGGTKGGILATMRSCLLECTGDYVLPVDADDLLTPDALSILTSVASSSGMPDLVHSDEDVLDDDRFRDPFLRPDWDPVLHVAGSYVWHALCIKRSTAIEVDLYGDPTFEWCHDWDTIERIRRTHGRIVHLPEVLYHWRRHSGSSTNTDLPETAQQASVIAMFDRMAADTGHPERYSVAEFPLWRGATEFHLHRRPVDPPTLSLLTLGQATESALHSIAHVSTFPMDGISLGPVQDATLGLLLDALRGIETSLVWLLDPSVVPGNDEPLWEAIKWFELLSDVGAVGGRFVSIDGLLKSGADVCDNTERTGVLHPLAGRPITDPGPYALALKPHSVDVVDARNTVFDRSMLIEALKTLPQDLTIGTCGAHLGHSIESLGRRVVYTPLMTALDPVEDIVCPAPVSRDQGRRGMQGIIDGRRQFV